MGLGISFGADLQMEYFQLFDIQKSIKKTKNPNYILSSC
jgi:hypothetical protein